MKRKTLGVSVLILAVVAVYFLFSGRGQGPNVEVGAIEGPPVTVYSVASRFVADRSEALGTTRAQESVDLSATVTERIEEVLFEDGEWVDAGQPLIVLRQSAERAQLAEERENLAEHQRELQRLDDLASRRLASQTDIDQRRTQVARSEFRIQEIESRLADLTIRAPFAGQVGLRRISPGALAQPGMVLATLDDMRRIKLDFRIPSLLLPTVERGQSVLATTSGFARVFEGQVVAIDSRINPVDRSIGVLAEFDNPELVLRPGLLMTVELRRQPREALVIPEESLLARQMQQYVWVVDPNTFEVSERSVEVGLREPGWVEVVSGIEAGEWLVREGVSLVRDGLVVRVANADSPSVAPHVIGAH